MKVNTLDHILKRYKLTFDSNTKMPIEIPGVGRENLAELFRNLNFKTGAEIGVEEGVYSEMLCKANPGLKLYSIDSWKAYKGYRDHTRQSKLDRFYLSTLKRLRKYNSVIIRKYSTDACKDFRDGSLDFVYIDANHKDPYVTDDLRQWYKKVRPGGILSGHDYVFSRKTSFDVVNALKKFTVLNNIKPWFVLGAWKRHPGAIRDESRSWMIVK